MKRPNILLISIDSLRADHLSMYGYPLPVSPNLENFANDAVVYHRAYSAANWTGAAIASILTGLYPSTHGYTNQHYYLDNADYSIATILQQQDYHTICFSNNMYLSSKSGLHAGFDEMLFRGRAETKLHQATKSSTPQLATILSQRSKTQIKNIIDLFDHTTALQRDDGAWETEVAVQKWLHCRDETKPFFAYIHYQEPHSIYFPPLPFRRKFHRSSLLTDHQFLEFDHMGYYGGVTDFTASQVEHYRQLYDGEIAYLDWRLGRLLQFFKDKNLWNDTVIIITADHGEMFGENNYFWHAFCLYEPLIRVPLLLRFPAWFRQAEVRSLAQSVDIVPTLLDGLQIPWQFSGKQQGQSLTDKRTASLTETFNPEPMIDRWLERRPHLHKEDFRQYIRDLRAIHTEDGKLVHASDGWHEFYRLQQDAAEQQNVYEQATAEIRHAEQQLKTWVQALPKHQADAAKPAFDKSTWESMRDLGYA